jgi:hypothetical protein
MNEYNLEDPKKGLFGSDEPQFDPSLFQIDKEKGLVNLTKIANHFDKRVAKWKELPSTQRFLQAFFEKNPESENWTVVNGGPQNGTWASKKIALKFAEWISVDFEIFANQVLDDYFSKPKQEQAKQLSTLDILKITASEIERLDEENRKLQAEAVLLNSQDLTVKTQKEWKWKSQMVQNNRGRSINYYVSKHFFTGDYAEAHRKAKEAYREATGINLPPADLMSIDMKKDYLLWLSQFNLK